MISQGKTTEIYETPHTQYDSCLFLPLPLTVGDYYKTSGRPAKVSYQMLERYADIHGWHPVEKALPLPLDLVLLRTDQGEKNGWYTGSKTCWVGYRLEDGEKIIAWKRIE